MPFYLSLANFLNGCIWVIYALIEFDAYILVRIHILQSTSIFPFLGSLILPAFFIIIPHTWLILEMCTYNLYSFFIYSLQISNGLGAISGLVQLILYAWFYRTTPKDDDDSFSKPNEVQLSSSNRAWILHLYYTFLWYYQASIFYKFYSVSRVKLLDFAMCFKLGFV